MNESVNDEEYVKQLQQTLQLVFDVAGRNETKAKEAQKRRYDDGRKPIKLSANDLVWYYQPKRVKGQVQKFHSHGQALSL
jgi:predicted transcriptional regulator